MTPAEIHQYISTFQLGEMRLVPFNSEGSLGPDTTFIRNELTRQGDGYSLVTYFREFWPEQGWSSVLQHREIISEEKLFKALSFWKEEVFGKVLVG